MPNVERDIEVEAPLSVVYNQWTQFEEFPQFMEGVEEVRQIDPRRLHWKADIGGNIAEWEAQIDEQKPDEIITWHSASGRGLSGSVSFRPAGEDRTNVHLDMSYEPEGFKERVGEMLGLIEGRVEGDLERFKEFIEARGHETGGWRGSIHTADVRNGKPVGGAGAVGEEKVETHLDTERTRAEERQAGAVDPDEPQASPGGGPVIDPATGEPRTT